MPSSPRPVVYMTATEKLDKERTHGKSNKKKSYSSSRPKVDNSEEWRMSMTGVLFGGPRAVPVNEDWNKMWNDKRRARREERKAADAGQSKPKIGSKLDEEVFIVYEEDDEICESDTSIESDLVVLTSGSEADSEPDSEPEPLPPKEKKKQYNKPAAPSVECLKKKAAKARGNMNEVVCVKKLAKKEKANHNGNGEKVVHLKKVPPTKDLKKAEETGTETETSVEMSGAESDSESEPPKKKGKKTGKKSAPKPVVKKVGFAESSLDNFSESPEPESSHTEGEDSSASSSSTAVEVSGAETSGVESSESTNSTKNVKSGKDDKNENAGKNGKNTESDVQPNGHSNRTEPSSNWTSAEDSKILSMKAKGETWASIGKEVSRGKKEVQKRWKELKSAQDTPVAEGNNHRSKPDVTSGEESVNPKASGAAVKDKPAEQKGASPKKKVRINNTSSSSSSHSSVERARQRRHIYRAALANQVGSEQLGERWTASDNETLDLLEAQRTAGRWLELQAKFYNATGRMVPVSVLRRKVRTAEKEREKKDGAAGCGGNPSEKGTSES